MKNEVKAIIKLAFMFAVIPLILISTVLLTIVEVVLGGIDRVNSQRRRKW